MCCIWVCHLGHWLHSLLSHNKLDKCCIHCLSYVVWMEANRTNPNPKPQSNRTRALSKMLNLMLAATREPSMVFYCTLFYVRWRQKYLNQVLISHDPHDFFFTNLGGFVCSVGFHPFNCQSSTINPTIALMVQQRRMHWLQFVIWIHMPKHVGTFLLQ